MSCPHFINYKYIVCAPRVCAFACLRVCVFACIFFFASERDDLAMFFSNNSFNQSDDS